MLETCRTMTTIISSNDCVTSNLIRIGLEEAVD